MPKSDDSAAKSKKPVAKKTTKPVAKKAAAQKSVKSTAAASLITPPESVSSNSSAKPTMAKSLLPKIERRMLGWIASFVVLVAVMVTIIFGVLIYQYKSESSVVYDVARVIPFPVERVNGQFVSYREYLFELDSIKTYYANQLDSNNKPTIDFSTADGKAKLVQLRHQVLDQLKSDTVTKQQIAKYKVTVTKKEVDDQINQIVSASGGLDKVKSVLTKYYNYSLNDLRNKVQFQIARDKLSTKISSDDSINAQAKAKADQVLKQIQGGADFATLAKQYSQDSSASNGGDIGFFGKGTQPQAFETAAFALKVGQVSGVVKTQFGYQIIKVLEIKGATVHAQEILIKGVDFEQWISNLITTAKTSIYLKV